MSVEFKELTVRFGSHYALENLSFTAEPGQITGLLGRNGAGKTTALRVLVGLERATSGRALINGKPFHSLPVGQVGVALAAHFPPTRTVIQQISLSALAGGATKDDVLRTLEATELAEVANKRAMALSLGMRQRLMLACATVASPKVLILDEPVNGLDPDGIAWLHHFLAERARQGVAVLVSTHFLRDLETYADKVVIIQRKALWAGQWPNQDEPSLDNLFSRMTAGISVS
jgi:ABC-2 type transport system ATP-binding protein